MEIAAAGRSHRALFLSLEPHRQGLLAVTLAAVLWSSGGLLIKWVDLDAFGITMWRSVFAALTIAALMRPGWVVPWRAGWLTLGLAVSYAAMLVFFVMATRLTTAANAIFLQYTAPFYVLLLGHFILRERATRLDIATLVAAFAGMALFFVGRLRTEDVTGNLFAVTSGAAFAVFLVMLRLPACGPKTRPTAMVYGNLLLVVAMVAVNAVRGEGAFTPGVGDMAALVFLGVCQIGLAYVVFTFGIIRVHALEAALIGMLEPVLNPIWVFAFLGETPGWWAVAGGAVIVAAVGGRTLVTERRRPATAAFEAQALHSEA